MKQGRIILLAALISLAAHAVFFIMAPHIGLPGMSQVMAQTRMMFRLRDVEQKTATVSFFEETLPPVSSIKMTRQASITEGGALKKMMLDKKPVKSLPLEDKKIRMQKEPLKEIPLEEREKFNPQDMLKNEEAMARKDAAPEKKSLAQRLLDEDLVSASGNPGSDAGELTHNVSQASFDAPLGGTEVWAPAGAGTYQDGKGLGRGRAQVGDYEDMSQLLDVALDTYEDIDTGEKYFRLVISVKKGASLEIIPKEITFLIDSSKSITAEKLSCIKEGVLDSVGSYNPGDRFNLVAFRGNLVRFREKTIPATEKTVSEARSFIRQLEAVGQTDVENALLKIIDEPVTFRPSYIVLITDGRPTTGVTDSRRIIQQITRHNNMERPIFCFGGGLRVNRYLLDFISYQNRAWSRFADQTYDMAKDFNSFYRQIKDPVLLNVRYRLNGLDPGEVYPKYLSDFYQARPFTLYGRFESEDVFSVQLLGEINGTVKELIFERSLKEAPAGEVDIAREWAFRKIYYLISRNTMGKGDTLRLRGEIEALSRKYGITTPYDIEDKD